MGSTWSYLDMTPLGRQEQREDSPEGYPHKWWNWHDNYDAEPVTHPKWVDILTDPSRSRLPQARRRGKDELNLNA